MISIVPEKASQADVDMVVKLRALGHATRIQILRLLVQHGGTLTVEDVVAHCAPLCQPTVSHHLRELRHAGLVELNHKSGCYCYYVIRGSALADVTRFLDALGGLDG